MRRQRGFAGVAFADDDKVLFFLDPVQRFQLLDLPSNTGFEFLRVKLLVRQPAGVGLAFDRRLPAQFQFLTEYV